MFTLLKRTIKAGWQVFTRDGYGLAAANVFILVLTISLITGLFIMKDASGFLISKIEEKADISIFFKEEVPEENIIKIKDDISKIPAVKEIDYISKDEAFDQFVEKHRGESALMQALEEVGRNPFLASVNIKAGEVSQYEAITSLFEGSEYKDQIEKIDYYQRKPLIERVFEYSAKANKAGLFLAMFLILISVLITFNTIRLSILNFGEEISTQRLVGASNWFIRGPFMVQGIIYGVLATLICLAIFGSLSWFFSARVEGYLPGLSLFNIFLNNFWNLALIQLVSGILVGVVSGLLAIRRYLRI